MLAGLPWMTDTSRAGAYEKVTDLVKNIAFPHFIVDNATLDEYYSLLTFDANDGYFQMIKKLQRFNRYLQYNYLTKSSGERDDFLGPPGIVNAWYQVRNGEKEIRFYRSIKHFELRRVCVFRFEVSIVNFDSFECFLMVSFVMRLLCANSRKQHIGIQKCRRRSLWLFEFYTCFISSSRN
jgi:hypothetical protein